MKKFLSVLTAALCLTACAFPFAACGDNNNNEMHTTHNWSATYTEDGDRHYQTCDGCDEKNYGEHDYGTDGVCVCGKHKPDTTVAVTGVTLDNNTLTLEIGGTATLTATVAPENATDKSVTWESDKTNITTVDNTGKITAIKDGTAVITAKTANGKSASCTVTVTPKNVPVTGVELNKSSLTLEIGEEETLTATVAPDNATDKSVTWESDKTNIATVDNTGKVTAIKDGTATITAKTANGKTATCSITVNAPLTNAQVLQFLNDNVLLEAARSCIPSSVLPEVKKEDVKNATWYITKENENIISSNLVFTYSMSANQDYVILCNIDYSLPLTPQKITNNEIGTPAFNRVYRNIINVAIQTEHTALTNAICNKLFGENQNATRYIIDHGTIGTDEGFTNGKASRFTVIEITDTEIKEQRIHINLIDTDDKLIECLNDTTKYYIYHNADKSVAITGDKLENNNAPFFG